VDEDDFLSFVGGIFGEYFMEFLQLVIQHVRIIQPVGVVQQFGDMQVHFQN
jgi:hypothetical protein